VTPAPRTFFLVAVRFLAEAVNRGAGLLLFPLIAGYLGATAYGIQMQASALIGVLVPVSTLGLGFSVVRTAAGRVDPKHVSARFTSTFRYVLIPSIGLGVGVFVAAPLLETLFFKDSTATTIVRWSALLVPIGAVESLLIDFYRARLRFGAYAFAQCAQCVLLVGGVAQALASGGGLVQVVIVGIVVKLLAVVGMFVYFHVVGEVDLRSEPLAAADVDEMVRLGLPVVVMGLSTWFLSLGDRLVIGWFRDARQVGIYAAAYALAGLVGAVGSPFWSPLYPLMAARHREADRAGLVAASRRFTSSYFTLGIPMVAGLTLLGVPALTLVGSHEFAIGRPAFGAIALGLLADQTTAVAYYVFYLEKESARLRNIALAAAVVNLALNVALVPTFGIPGAAFATLLAYGLVSAWLWAIIGRHGYRSADFCDFGWLLRVIMSSVVMTVVLLLIGVDVTTIGALLVRACLGAMIYGAALAAMGGWRRIADVRTRVGAVKW
jgi:O-antigen/teichoic acid export membrane protein